VLVVELARIVEQEVVAGLREGVGARRGPRGELLQGVVPLLGELVPHGGAQPVQRLELGRGRAQPARPRGRVPVDLVGHRQRRGVAQHHVGVPDPGSRQRQARREGQVVHDHLVRPDAVHHALDAPGRAQGIPEQVVAPGARLEGQGLGGAAAGGGEEAAQRVVLPGRLLLRPDDPGVGAAAQRQDLDLEAEAPGDGGRRGAGGHDHPLPGVPPRGGQGREGEQVGGVVRADHEQGHGVGLLSAACATASS
jgi:hypothetical protein